MAPAAAAPGIGGAGIGGSGIDCENLAAGPFTPEVVLDVFSGSEDFAFDGMGNIAGKGIGGNMGVILLSDANGQTSTVATNIPSAFGMRFFSNGNLAVALPSEHKLIQVTPNGDVTDIETNVMGPNGVYVDSQDTLWVTEGGNVIRIPLGGSKETIVTGAPGSNGVLYDEDRGQLFYTQFSNGNIRRTDPNNVAPVTVSNIGMSTGPDGLAMDACGNLYVVAQQDGDVYRIRLDENGDATAAPELLAHTPLQIANPNFGSGAGFDPTKLYVAGNPGTVYSIAVGVPGK